MKSIVSKIYASSLSEALEGKLDSEGGIFSNTDSIGGLASAIINISIPLAGIAAVILIVIASYKMISSQGNPEKLKDAKEMITNAIIGLVFILLSVSILLLVSSLFNLGVQG
jgi:phosphatidylglycerophosphatase A